MDATAMVNAFSADVSVNPDMEAKTAVKVIEIERVAPMGGAYQQILHDFELQRGFGARVAV